MKYIIIAFLLFVEICSFAQKTVFITSPDQKISVNINTEKEISYSIEYQEKKILNNSPLSITLYDGKVLGLNSKLSKSSLNSVSRKVKPLYGMASSYNDEYNEVKLDFKEAFSVIFRVYNNGVAYRFITSKNGKIKVKDEQVAYNFAGDTKASIHKADGFLNSYEELYQDSTFDILQNNKLATLPLYAEVNGIKAVITESDLLNYAGLYLTYNGKNSLKGALPKFVTKDSVGGCCPKFERIPYERADYIAEIDGKSNLPWRLIILEKSDKDLLYNNLVYLLASENKIGDASWVKPGKVAWDWWSANNLTGVDFKTGFNTATYKYFIDFAAKNGIEYVNLDEGWSDQFDLLKVNTGKGIVNVGTGATLEGGMDMLEVVRYSKEKNVGLFLWCVWHTLDRQMIPALDQFQKWGIKGIKVDFMDRDDQTVVNFYERLAIEAAKRKIMVNYHGGYKPTGMQKTYPNLINREAIRGLEYNKFGEGTATPENLLHQVFIRMVAGEADYTPGAMHNANKNDFRAIAERPMSYGTRCQQLALFTMLYAPLEMLADAPTAYEKEPEILNYFSKMPTIWDETLPIDGKLGDFAVIARKKDATWHVAGITDWTSRKVKVKFDFLDEGIYKADIFQDGANAHRVGNDYKKISKTIKKGDEMEFEMASGGGFVIKLVK